MRPILFFILFCFSFKGYNQELSGLELLNKAISYHDPNGNWTTFNGKFKVTMTSPKKNTRVSDITINLPDEFFEVTAVKDSMVTTYKIGRDNCQLFFNNKELSKAEGKAINMTCKGAKLYKNYYTYLYGLPMKLKDAGTFVDPIVETKPFKDKNYLVLKVTYDENVGTDVWNFYFNPKTYAMEVYQFYKTDDNGKTKSDSGEYILLSDEEVVNGIRMPKVRSWYYNKDDKYLGTDILSLVTE